MHIEIHVLKTHRTATQARSGPESPSRLAPKAAGQPGTALRTAKRVRVANCDAMRCQTHRSSLSGLFLATLLMPLSLLRAASATRAFFLTDACCAGADGYYFCPGGTEYPEPLINGKKVGLVGFGCASAAAEAVLCSASQIAGCSAGALCFPRCRLLPASLSQPAAAQTATTPRFRARPMTTPAPPITTTPSLSSTR